jgi:hypothetical protein
MNAHRGLLMHLKPSRLNPFWVIAKIFIVAVVLNYVWEIAQGILYAGMDYKKDIWLHCFIASLGDGLLVWIIHLVGWGAFGRSDWFMLHHRGPWLVMIATGLLIGIMVEWVAVHLLGRWSYTDQMPLVPGLEIGLVPILQMLVLPPLVFAIVAK